MPVDTEESKRLHKMAPDVAHRNRVASASTARRYQQRVQAEMRSVAPIPPIRNMRRRSMCRHSLKAYCEQYFAPIFYFGWSVDQLDLINELERVIIDGSNKAVAMPRGGGKTSLCTIATNWAISYGHRSYIYFVRDTQKNAEASLNTIRRIWEQNDALLDDFPEIAWPVRSIEGSHLRGRMQTFGEERTYIQVSTSEFIFPYLPTYPYIDSDKRAAGAIICTTGITGSMRGSNRINPYTGEINRPDLIILDDVQTDAVAGSPTTIERYIDLIDGALKGMSGPGETIAAVMPCTVINQGDVSDTYLNPLHKPEWRGHRGKMVISWPPGITDTEITNDTKAGKLWNEYATIRVQSLVDHGDIRDATKHYKKNRKAMDDGFTVSWEERFIKTGNNAELSAHQHAMNLRLENIITFLSEYQNTPNTINNTDLIVMPTPDQVAQRTSAIERGHVPYYAQCMVTMIDVQDEIMWYATFACDLQYGGIIIDYDTFPSIKGRQTFTKQATLKRKELSYAFFKAHPDYPRDFSLRRDTMGKAPFEAKIRWGIQQIIDKISDPGYYTRADRTPVPINFIGVDCKWGASTDTILRTVADLGDSRIVPYEGTFVGATSRQLGEWARNKPGRVFEDQMHKNLNKCRWMKSPVAGASISKLFSDVNAWKTFLIHRLTCPVGGIGSVQLFNAHPAAHNLFSLHIAKSEYPLQVTARGRTVTEWKELSQGGWPDNDWLDTVTGCMCLASLCGCRIPDTVQAIKKEDDKSTSEADKIKKDINKPSKDNVNVQAATEQQRGQQTAGKTTAHFSNQQKRRSMAAVAAAKRKERQKGQLGTSNLGR